MLRNARGFLKIAGAAAMVGLLGCDDSTGPEEPVLPTTYNFENVNFAGQTTRLDMMDEIANYMKSGHKAGTVLDAAKLKAMFANEGAPFASAALNAETTKKIQDKTFAPDVGYFLEQIDSMAVASASSDTAINGRAGRLFGPTRTILVDANGFEYAQLIEKGLMGACFYYQGVAVYLNPEGKLAETVDNSTVVAGQGTAMQHNWDESFGYFTSSIGFPDDSLSTARYWSKYGKSRNTQLSSNDNLLKAFIKGRAAIGNKDRATMLEAVSEVRAEWEKVSAGTAVHYLNAAKKKLTDDAECNHALSEAVAFIKALKYNPAKKITEEQITEVLDAIGSNLYEVTPAGLDKAKSVLVTVYGFGSVADAL